MFDWFKRKPDPKPPETDQGNPGKGTGISVKFDNGARSWTEELDLVSCLADVLLGSGHDFSKEKSVVQMNTGLVMKPGFVGCQLAEGGGVQTMTTIEVRHAAGIPAGVFEFQHSNGKDLRDSVAKGFAGWRDLDLPVMLDAMLTKPEKCPVLQIEQPAEGGNPSFKRRIVLGPASHYAARPAAAEQEEHPFCPCCLFTRSLEAFKVKLGDGQFYGIRLYAARDGNGEAAADCRLNGLDYEPGKRALIDYVKTWPDRGLEFRKQYVILQTAPPASG